MKVYVSAHMKMLMTFHKSFMFCYTSDIPIYIYIYIYFCSYVIMNRHGHHNIRIGILWAQIGHNTSKCAVALCLIEL